MSRYLIEVPHEREIMACARAIRILLNTGSHYLTHADFGCGVGEHKSWITVEVESEQEARAILPPAFRAQAKIIRLENFSLEQIDEMLAQHQSPTPAAAGASAAPAANAPGDSAGNSSGLARTQSSVQSPVKSSERASRNSSGQVADPPVEDAVAQPVG